MAWRRGFAQTGGGSAGIPREYVHRGLCTLDQQRAHLGFVHVDHHRIDDRPSSSAGCPSAAKPPVSDPLQAQFPLECRLGLQAHTSLDKTMCCTRFAAGEFGLSASSGISGRRTPVGGTTARQRAHRQAVFGSGHHPVDCEDVEIFYIGLGGGPWKT